MSICLRATSIDATRVLANAVAPNLRARDIVLLDGELGTGKTAFTQFLAAALGVSEPVTSPTFAIMNQYECDSPTISMLAHLDAYRLGDADGIEQLGLFELIDDGALVFIEWGSLVADAFDEALRISFSWVGETSREITFTATSAQWASRIDAMVSTAEAAGLARC